MRQVLVLRPEPGASATIKRALEHGLDAVAAPLFEIERVAWTAPDADEFDALLLTSANSLHYGGDQLDGLLSLPVYAVGELTAKAARERGFEIAATGNGGIDELLGSIPQHLRLLHLGGEHRRGPARARASTGVISVYRARELETEDLGIAQGTVALIHSPRAGRRFAELVQDRGDILIAAISTAAAEAVGTGWGALETAAEPGDDGLLALAASLCNKPVPK
ncbi:MAG TPA: uroporphyrinogen-III synthase [Sphingomicrobium sp.]|jgi:uroporphyrinogen-III synthase|nr:uroporphyrinogen-III synthase [Sphingomicrobium sp.]